MRRFTFKHRRGIRLQPIDYITTDLKVDRPSVASSSERVPLYASSRQAERLNTIPAVPRGKRSRAPTVPGRSKNSVNFSLLVRTKTMFRKFAYLSTDFCVLVSYAYAHLHIHAIPFLSFPFSLHTLPSSIHSHRAQSDGGCSRISWHRVSAFPLLARQSRAAPPCRPPVRGNEKPKRMDSGVSHSENKCTHAKLAVLGNISAVKK